jgi:hypothetical protein
MQCAFGEGECLLYSKRTPFGAVINDGELTGGEEVRRLKEIAD